MNSDPNQQQEHTFGSSRAAERLKKEIDNGANYRAAVRILNRAQTYVNELRSSGLSNLRYWLQILREDTNRRIDKSTSDLIVRSLCRNVFAAKCRVTLSILKTAGLIK